MLLSLGLYWTAWDRLYAGLKLGRAPRTKETLPDFLKWRRVTRPPLIFRGLTGSQRTPGFGASQKHSVQELQGVISQGEEEILVLPSTPTASQLLNSTAITEEQINNWAPNTMESAQATAGVEEIILLDPPRVNFDNELVRCLHKPNCSSTIFTFCLNLVNLVNFSYF